MMVQGHLARSHEAKSAYYDLLITTRTPWAELRRVYHKFEKHLNPKDEYIGIFDFIVVVILCHINYVRSKIRLTNFGTGELQHKNFGIRI